MSSYQIFQIFRDLSRLPQLFRVLLARVHRLQQDVVPVLLQREMLTLYLKKKYTNTLAYCCTMHQ